MTHAVSFEAKLYAYRKDGKGIIASFIVQPQDVPPELALADIGQRFAVALGQLRDGDGKEPLEQGARKEPKSEARSERARADHQLKTPQEQAMGRSAILCNDPRFQKWLETHCAARGVTNSDQPGPDATAKLLRHMLAIDSRREIGEGGRAYRLFLELEGKYKEAHGMLAEQRR